MTTQPPRPGDTLRSFDRGQQQRQQQDQQRRREQERQQREREAMTTPRQDVPRPGETLGIERRGPQRPTPERRDPRQQVEEARRIAAQERFTQAQEALGNRSIIEYVAQGGDLERLTDLGIDAETVATLRAIQPHLNGDGRTVDVPGALQAGVTPDVLGRVVDRRAVQQVQEALAAPPTGEAPAEVAAQDIPADRPLTQQELSELPIGAALMQEAAQQPLTIPTPRPTGPVMPEPGAALQQFSAQHVNSLNRQIGLAQSMVIGGARAGQDLNTSVRLAEQRTNQFWNEFGQNIQGMRTSFTGEIGGIQRQIAATQERLNILNQAAAGRRDRDWNGRPITPEIARNNLPTYQNQLQQQRDRLALTQQALTQFDQHVQAIRRVIQQETIPEAMEAVRRTVTAETLPAGVVRADPTRSTDEIQAVLQDVRTYEDLGRALEEGRVTQAELTSMGFSTEDVQQAQQVVAAQRTREGILGRVGDTVADAADALREGRITEAELRQVLEPETAQQIVEVATQDRVLAAQPAVVEPPLQPQRMMFTPEEELAVAPDRRESVISAVQELGPHAAVQQGRATAAEVTGVFGPDVFRATPVEDLAIDPGRTIPIRQDEAITELGRMGFTDQQGGVFVADAAMSGQDALLLQAGFTQGQIDAAVSQRIVPTAEPRRRPAPGETLPVPEELTQELQQVRERIGELIIQMPAIGPAHGAGRAGGSTNPEEVAAFRQLEAIQSLIAAVESGDLTPEEAQARLQEVPREVTQEDRDIAQRRLGGTLQAAGGIPLAGIPLGAAGTAITFRQDTPVERGINIGTDVVSLIPLAGVAAMGARTAGAARGLTRAGIVARQMAAAELSVPTSPREVIRNTIIDPVEVIVRPGRAIGLEETFTTFRIPAEPGARITPQLAPEPAETIMQIRAGQITGGGMKEAVNDAAIQTMQTGRTTTAAVGDTGTTVTVRAGAAHRALGGAAFHATPDGRNIMAGPIEVAGREGGLFVAPTPMTRFAQATAFGEDIPLSESAQAAVAAGRLPAEPIPTVILIRDPDLLRLLQGPTDPTGAPKLFNHLAEVEALLPNGTVIPQAAQVRFMRGAAGERIALAVVGKPLSVAEQARLRVTGLTQTVRNIFAPGAMVQFEGAGAARSALKGAYISDHADALLAEARLLRRAGRTAEAVTLEGMAARVTARGRQLTGGAPARLAPSIDLGDRARRLDDGRPADAAIPDVGPGDIRLDERDVTLDRIGDGEDIRLVGESPRLSPRQTSTRLATLSRLATAAETRTLTDAQRQQAQRAIADLGRAELTTRQQARADADIERLRTTTPELPTRTPVAPTRITEPPRTPETPRLTPPPRTPDTPRVPTVTPPPRTPDVPRVPDAPRVPPGVPGIPPTEPPRAPTGLPDADPIEEAAQRGEFVRISGISRGAVGDTIIDHVEGTRQTVRDHPNVPSDRPTRQSFTVLATSQAPSRMVRERWGFLDLLMQPDGSFAWVRAGADPPPSSEFRPREEFNNSRPLQGRDRQRNRNPFRSRGMGRRRGL
jgi:hypothetical protein